MIRFEKVTKQFSLQSFGALDLSFDIEPGEMVFITGKSGSGKTTLGRLITKEYSPSSGEVFFNDQPLSQIKSNKIHLHRRQVGVVFQDYRLLPELTAWENIALPLSILNLSKPEIDKRVTDLLTLVSLAEKGSLFPSQLSGGEAQRVSIARALAMSPQVLFADEPTGNLDPDTALEISQILSKINSLGTTILFATHNPDLVANSPKYRLIQLENGKLVQDTGVKDKPKSEPLETKPLESKPLESKPLETKPLESKPPVQDSETTSPNKVVPPDQEGELPKRTPLTPKSWKRLFSWGLPTLKLPNFKIKPGPKTPSKDQTEKPKSKPISKSEKKKIKKV
ncbi:MAG: ATP-binding cassette domain-containing protein [Patescibacteria group bacterium]